MGHRIDALRRWVIRVGSRPVVIALAIAAALLVPLAVYGVAVRDTISRDVAERSAGERHVAARLAATSIDSQLRGVADALTFFGSTPSVRAGVAARDRATLDLRLRDLLEGRRNSLGAILDPKGIALAAPLAPDLVGQDFSGRDYFRGALASAGPYISEVFTSASPGSPSVVAVSYAIRSGSLLLGVAVVTLLPADLLALLRPLDQAEGRELLLVDAAGRAIVSTDGSFAPLAALDLPPGAVQPSQGVANIAGRERVVTAGPVESAGWVLYVLDDPRVILRAQRALLRDLAGAGILVTIFALMSAAAVAILYGKTARQRDQLRASRAALAETNDALQQASRHKSEFLASMSHELRTPLNAILGFSDLLAEQLGSALSDRQRRYLRNIRDAGEHLLGLINDVLDLSKVEAGRVEIRREVVTLGAIAEPVISSTRAAADARGISFSAEMEGGTRLAADPARMRQILYNLLSNAVKFTPAGGHVRLRASAEDGHVSIEVSDTGIGIPADRQDRVFGTFERLHEGRSDAPGTGLGLALTKRLVELHGGTIGFESREGQGTTFRIALPNALPAAETTDRVLVVEDDLRDAELIVALAAKAGLPSEVVASKAAASSAIRREVPIGVVLDLQLPDGRGEDLLAVMRSDPRTQAVPVIVVTVEDDEGRSRTIGADDHLTKPFDHARVEAWLRRIAARSARDRVLAQGAA